MEYLRPSVSFYRSVLDFILWCVRLLKLAFLMVFLGVLGIVYLPVGFMDWLTYYWNINR